jgi:dTDP-glucose 4,6-dehydratase
LVEPEAASGIDLHKLTYADKFSNLRSVSALERHSFIKGDIKDPDLVSRLLKTYQPSAVIHFAAESHVDRSIHGAEEFIQTNVVGTFNLLQSVRHYWSKLESEKRDFRFLHISTIHGRSLRISVKEDPAFARRRHMLPTVRTQLEGVSRPSGESFSSHL